MLRPLRTLHATHRRPRGQSMLAAIVVVAVLAILGATALVYTGQGLSSARQFQKREALSACGTAARSWVLSRFRPGAKNADEILQFNESKDFGRFTLRTGHVDAQGPAVKVIVGSTPNWSTIDLTNTTARDNSRLGGKTYQAVVTCIDNETGAATEVEFSVRLAL